MKPHAVTVAFQWSNLTLTADCSYYPETPSFLSGPPEKCYEGDPAEVEIESLTCDDADVSCLLNSDHAEDICDLALAACEKQLTADAYADHDYA